MAPSTQRRADTTTDTPGDVFARLSEPYRRELLAYCYRMLGSIHDAEDVLQETYLQAWRGYDGFEGRASIRTWLYRIATRACLKALEGNGRRPLPSGLGGPSEDPEQPLRPSLLETPWLQPAPDTLFGTAPADPAAVVEARQNMRLGFVAALQYLPGRQRAVLILRDVLAWRATEVAALLGTTTAAVNSALQRARTQLGQVAPTQDGITEPTEPDLRALLDRYATAFETADIATLTGLLAADAVWEMPPVPTWFAGRETIGRFLAAKILSAGAYRLAPATVNGEPSFGSYTRDHTGVYRPHALQVLSVTPAGITHVVAFLDPGLFPLCHLPASLPDTPGR
ncbi:sigma-70 family RNA polymerase sigma factor [Streptosporangium sp. 'caverna']|uniref:sigma-70 family RNA polymerase sigma factor n=1 Tax=Streptosporangium sp. 'caverna' TaxID=2202249 RepID=UPI000D7DAF63|nr:sigma-70 family RNA polymerase sigma factor [Streptosporangium sp. 'caverna']AWS44922.1 RNA polymerase subunit sigma-70 [Streptosporangium sp. 'caverna']